MDEYRRKSTFLGDKDIYDFVREQDDKRKHKERKQREYIVDMIPKDVKSKPFSGVEKEQLLKGMSLLTVYQRRIRKI